MSIISSGIIQFRSIVEKNSILCSIY